MYIDPEAWRRLAFCAALLMGVAGGAGCASDGPVRPRPRPPPAFEPPPGPAGVPRVDVRWQAVNTQFRSDGAILASMNISAPSVRVFLPRSPRVQLAGAEDDGTRAFSLREVPESLRDVWSLDAQLVAIRDGEIYVRDGSLPKRVPLWIHDLELSVENVATRRALTGGLPGLLLARARAWRTGVLTAFVAADPFGTALNFSGQAAIRHLDLREIASFFPETVGLRPTAGTLDIYLVFAAEAGQLRGGAKIILRDVEVDARGGFWRDAKAATIDLLLDLFSDDGESRDAVATIVPIEGTLTDPEVQVWPAVLGVLYNAFVTAFEASYSGIPPRLAPTRQGVGEQTWRVLIGGRPPRAQPTPPSEPGAESTARQTWRSDLLEADVSGIPVAVSPAGLARPGGILAVQRALISRRLLPAGHRTGMLDQATQSALRVLQREARLPATGLPGFVTLDVLELDPHVVFHHANDRFRLARTRPPGRQRQGQRTGTGE